MGGMFSSVLLPLVNRRCLASLTIAKPHPLPYMITTNNSRFCMRRDSRLNSKGPSVNATSVSVSPGVFCQDVQAVFLPHPRNWDVVPHPVMAWKSCNARDLEGPRLAETSWTVITYIFFPIPKHTHSSEKPNMTKNAYGLDHHITINRPNIGVLMVL